MMSNSRIDQLTKFLEENPADSFVRYALATEYINLNDDETALAYFLEILRRDPEYTGMYYHLGKLYQRLNEKELAEETFKNGMTLTYGKDPHAHHELQEAMNQLLDDY